MRNPIARAVCRLAATVVAAVAFYRYSWMPSHADHMLRSLQSRTQAALETPGDDRAIFAARDNIERLQTIESACRLSVDYQLIYAVNARILGRNDEAIEHYTAALDADHRPEIYFDRGVTYLEEGKLDPATADIALATRFNPAYLQNVDAGMQARVAAVNKAVPYNPPPR
jgi:tetratricopeptide (TPR) repeat protein